MQFMGNLFQESEGIGLEQDVSILPMS